MNTGVLDKTRCYLVGHMQYADPGDWREVVKEALKDTNIIFFFEFISKDVIFFFKSLVFNRSKTKEYSDFEINFFKGEILYFSSTNKTLFIEFFLEADL